MQSARHSAAQIHCTCHLGAQSELKIANNFGQRCGRLVKNNICTTHRYTNGMQIHLQHSQPCCSIYTEHSAKSLLMRTRRLCSGRIAQQLSTQAVAM